MVVLDRRRFVVTRFARAALIVVLVGMVSAVLLCGCAEKGPTYVDNGTAHTQDSALTLLADADAAAVASRATSEGTKLRHDALAALRRQGPEASSVSDLLTRTFPTDTSGVPIYVERGTYGGRPAVLVVEATGPSEGTLNSKRLWVVSTEGDILFAGSR